MHICLLMYYYFPNYGLSAPYAIAHELATMGIKVSILALRRNDEPEFEFINGIAIYRISVSSSLSSVFKLQNISFVWQCKRLLSEIQPDIVHTYSFFGCFLLPMLDFDNRYKWLLDVRSSIVNTRYPPLVLDAINRFLGIHALSFDAVGVLSDGIAKKIFGKRASHPYFLTPLGVNIDQFDCSNVKKPCPAALDFNENSFVLIYQGSIAPERRVDLMVRAFAKAREAIPRLKLLLVGDGAALQNIKDLVFQLEIAEDVIFTGYVPFAEMPNYVCSADMALSYIPITDVYEHQPALKTIEYLAAGLPIVATDSGSNHFFMTDDVGIFAKDDVDSFSDAIVALYKRRAEFDTIKQKAKKIAQKHSWSSITMNQLIPKYKNLMEQ